MFNPDLRDLLKDHTSRYSLVTAVAKRARELVTQDSSYLADSGMKPISLACKEIYEGKIKIVNDKD